MMSFKLCHLMFHITTILFMTYATCKGDGVCLITNCGPAGSGRAACNTACIFAGYTAGGTCTASASTVQCYCNGNNGNPDLLILQPGCAAVCQGVCLTCAYTSYACYPPPTNPNNAKGVQCNCSPP